MSRPPGHRSTLALRLPFGRVLLATVLALVAIASISEMLARSETVEAHLPLQTINGDPEIGDKLMKLDQFVAKSGRPGCIIIGSSMVQLGIDPDSISQAFEQSLGRPLPCFNFGISGIDALAAGRIAAALVHEYHPWVLIWGLSFRDFMDTDHSLNVPWARYYQGSGSLESWLEVHSYAYRYALTYRNMLRSSSIKLIPSPANGFAYSDRAMNATGQITLADRDQYAQWSEDFLISPGEELGLTRFLALSSSDVQILMVEMPLFPGILDVLPKGQRTRRVMVDSVTRQAAARDVPFWLTYQELQIPSDGWINWFHMNHRGAEALGRWIGDRLAAAVKAGNMPTPTP
jgi:hypothetical protein